MLPWWYSSSVQKDQTKFKQYHALELMGNIVHNYCSTLFKQLLSHLADAPSSGASKGL